MPEVADCPLCGAKGMVYVGFLRICYRERLLFSKGESQAEIQIEIQRTVFVDGRDVGAVVGIIAYARFYEDAEIRSY